VREFVADTIGERYLNPVLAITDDPRTLKVAELPPQFVVKATHASGFTLLANRSETSDEQLQARCRQWLATTFGVEKHEDWYAPIPPRIIVERRLVDDTYDVPLDYKFWVFHGRVEFVQVDVARHGKPSRTFYDRNWTLQPWSKKWPPGAPVRKPTPLDEMIALAERLAGSIDFVRIDLYCVNDRDIYFGEVTLTPGAGYTRFVPESFDLTIGRLW
jgi:hypothetical protein